MSDLSVAALRKKLREHRKVSSKPVGKMAKHEVLMELGMKKEEAVLKAVEHAVAKVDVPIVKKAEKAIKKLHKEEKAVVVEKPVKVKKAVADPMMTHKAEAPKAEVSSVPTTGRAGLIKGSAEAREYMARIRNARKAKKESVN